MAKKGDMSKAALTKAILELYPDSSFVKDKCVYINFKEGGEFVQIKVALTAPTTPVDNPNEDFAPTATIATTDGGIDFSQYAPKKANVDFTQKEIETVNHLINLLDF